MEDFDIRDYVRVGDMVTLENGETAVAVDTIGKEVKNAVIVLVVRNKNNKYLHLHKTGREGNITCPGRCIDTSKYLPSLRLLTLKELFYKFPDLEFPVLQDRNTVDVRLLKVKLIRENNSFFFPFSLLGYLGKPLEEVRKDGVEFKILPQFTKEIKQVKGLKLMGQ